MSFAQLREIGYSTGFRIALIFLLLFSLSAFFLFGYVFWKTSHYMVNEVDFILYGRVNNLQQLSTAELINRIEQYDINDPADLNPRALFSKQGVRIVGGIIELPKHISFDKPHYFFAYREADQKRLRLRGILHRLPETGDILLVAKNIHELHEFNELLVRALVSGGTLMLLIGLIGGVVIGLSSQRQLKLMTQAIQKIIQGDLSERLPIKNNYGDLNKLAVIINQMLDEIERLMQQLKGTCDDIAHDLKTPLTRLLAGLERMQRKERTLDEYKLAINQAMSDANSLLLTFKALLRISEVENNSPRASFTPVDLHKIVSDVAEFFEPLAEDKQITLQLITSDTPIIIMGDPHLLFDALSNLLDNAIKFTPAQGAVTITLIEGEQQLRLEVSDTGIGIAEQEREAVLRRFYRSESSRSTPGNGLGLSMVAAVAHIHQMQLTISDANPGCCVSLTMPH